MSGHHDNEIDIDGEQGLRGQFATLIGTMQPREAAPTREDKEEQAQARPEDMDSKQVVVAEGLESAYQDNHAGATDGLQLNVIQNAYSKHDPTSWQLGNIGEKGYKVPSSPPSIAFAVSPGGKFNVTMTYIDGGLSLFSGTETGSIQEYIYDDEDGTWSDGYTFPNTDASRGASVFSLRTDVLLFAANNDQDIMFWSRRYDSAARTQWKPGPTSSYSLASNGSMCGMYDFVFQSPKGRIQGSNFPSQDDLIDRTFGTTYEIGNSNMLDGSALSCQFFFSNKPTFTRFHVFYQVESNDIVEVRNYWAPDEGKDMPENWSYQKVPTD